MVGEPGAAYVHPPAPGSPSSSVEEGPAFGTFSMITLDFPKAFKAGEASEGKFTIFDAASSQAIPNVPAWAAAVSAAMASVYAGDAFPAGVQAAAESDGVGCGSSEVFFARAVDSLGVVAGDVGRRAGGVEASERCGEACVHGGG